MILTLRETWEKLLWWNEKTALSTMLALLVSCVILRKSMNLLAPLDITMLPLRGVELLPSFHQAWIPHQFWPSWVCSRTSFNRNPTSWGLRKCFFVHHLNVIILAFVLCWILWWSDPGAASFISLPVKMAWIAGIFCVGLLSFIFLSSQRW